MLGAKRGRPAGVRSGPYAPRTVPSGEFGHVLREIRIANDLTLREFAVRLGYAENSFVNFLKYETGEKLPPDIWTVFDWMMTLGYQPNQEETRAILRATLKDQLDSIGEGYGRFILENS